MSQESNHKKQFDANDIRRYFAGEMNASEMHALEKAALEDPFLSDAMEGFQSRSAEHVSSDLEELSARLHDKTSGKIVPIVSARRNWYRYAAAAVLILFAAGGSWYLLNNRTDNSVVAVETIKEKKPVAPEPEANKAVANDTTNNAPNANAVTAAPKSSTTKPAPKSLQDEKHKDFETLAAPQAQASAPPEERARKADASNDVVLNKEKAPAREEDKPVTLNEDNAAKKSQSSPQAAGGRSEIQGFIGTHLFVGKVVDEAGHPLPFVNVKVNSTNTLSYTNAAGEFRFMAGDTALDVQLKSVGFQEKNTRISARSKSNNIRLDSQSNFSSNGHRNAVKDSLTRVESEAEPIDGWTNYDIYVDNNIRIPNANQPGARTGIVELSFNVNKNGTLTNFKIERSLDAISDREAIRVIKEGPKWEITSGDESVRVSLMIFF